LTGITSITFGSLAHDKLGFTITFDGESLPNESLAEAIALIRDYPTPAYPVALTGTYPDERDLFPLTTVLRENDYRFVWITNGLYIPANKTADDYWVVRLSTPKWLVHRCHELWWDGEGDVPPLPTPIPVLYLTCTPKKALGLAKVSPLFWNHIPTATHTIKEVLYGV